MPYINEAVWALHDGVAEAEAIDTIAKLGFAHPLGPLALADLIGLDTCVAIMEVLRDGLGNDRYEPCPLLRELVSAGKLGRKSGAGFYIYPRQRPRGSSRQTRRRSVVRLLLVDDDNALRALLRTTFEAVDVEVDEAANAVEAQERIAAARPDAIVMDVVMPGLDGTAFCALLKTAPRTRDIPVVLLTGSDVATRRPRARSAPTRCC